MKAFILAAGRGERMRPLTDTLPKPLVKVRGKALIDYHLEKIQRAGVHNVIINTAHLGHLVEQHVGNGERFGVSVHYSREPQPLETGGALHFARDKIAGENLLLVNGDVWSEFDYQQVIARAMVSECMQRGGAYLMLVPNPPFKRAGDFCVVDKTIMNVSDALPSFTFSGISVLAPELLQRYPHCRLSFPLKEVFDWAISHRALAGEVCTAQWSDVGTLDRLEALNQFQP